jgi:PAS domain S-box-containing protein
MRRIHATPVPSETRRPDGSAPPAGRIPFRLRIRVRILLVFLAVTISAVLITVSVHQLLARTVMRNNLRERNLQVARIAASKISQYMRSSLNDLRALDQIVVPVRDPWTLDLIIENTVTIHRQFASISLVSATGDILASSALDNSRVPFPGQVVVDALRTGLLTLSDVRLSEDATPTMFVAVPALGVLVGRGALVAELELREVWDEVDAISIGTTGQALLLSANGTLIAHRDKTRILTSALGSAAATAALGSSRAGSVSEERAEDGSRILLAAAQVEVERDVRWYIVVEQALHEAYVPLSQMLTATGLAMLGFILVAVASSFMVAGLFATPLARLLAGTERIRAGDLAHRIRIETDDEVGRLSLSFNAMVGDLEERSRSLASSEAKYRLLTESLSDIIFSLDAQGRIVYANPQAERILGLSPRVLEGQSAEGFLAASSADGAPLDQPHEVVVTATDGSRVVLEVKLVRSQVAGPAADGGVAYYGVARDITERKEAEARLATYQQELQTLTLQLSLTEARERKRIAAEIHDRIGQSLAFARIKLGQLAGGRLAKGQAELVREALPLLEQVIQDTRSLIFRVSSPLLYELGLSAALERLVEQFTSQHAVAMTYVEAGPIPKLETDVAVVLFDAVKELLANVVKHAGARNVRVTVSAADARLHFEVEDDGVGFDPKAPRRPDAGGYGLFSVRERIQYMRGQMEVDTCIGRGTHVTLDVPIQGALDGHRSAEPE